MTTVNPYYFLVFHPLTLHYLRNRYTVLTKSFFKNHSGLRYFSIATYIVPLWMLASHQQIKSCILYRNTDRDKNVGVMSENMIILISFLILYYITIISTKTINYNKNNWPMYINLTPCINKMFTYVLSNVSICGSPVAEHCPLATVSSSVTYK
jgi:hypothetical protein